MSIETSYAHATDLDVTFIVAAKPQEPESPEHIAHLANLDALRAITPAVEVRRNDPEQPRRRWGYASGRAPKYIQETQNEHRAVGAPLPTADFILASVGEFAIVHNEQTNQLEALPNWPPASVTEHWNLPKIAEIAEGIMDNTPPGALVWQEDDRQGKFKQSFYLAESFAQLLGEDQIQLFLADIEAMLISAGVEAKVLLSSAAGQPHRFLDIMASGVDKGTAYAAVCDYFGVPSENRSCSVDSGNDLELALASQDIIAVPNGEPTFIPRLRELLKDTPKRLIVPNKPSAAGVHQGLIDIGRLSV